MGEHYRFTARDWNGKKIRAEIFAADKKEALGMLQERNLVILDLRKQGFLQITLKNTVLKALYKLGYRSYTTRDLMIFCGQFATMLQAGISVLHCLRILSTQKEIASLQKQAASAAREIEQGGNLSSALQKSDPTFPLLMISMVEAGEATGKLDQIMEKMADHFEKQNDFKEKIRSATLYPGFIILVSLVVMAVMVIFVLPQFSGIFHSMGLEMPLFTRLLMAAVSFFYRHIIFFFAAFLLIATTALYMLRTKKGRRFVDRLRLHFPFLGKIYTKIIAARFARTMSTLLTSGISLHSALQLTDKVIDNILISDSMSSLGEALSRGETLAGSMRKSRYFPTLLTEMARIGEETGTLEHTLEKTALFYEKEVTCVVERLGTTLEPVLILFVGFFIGLLVFSIFAPMYRVYEMM